MRPLNELALRSGMHCYDTEAPMGRNPKFSLVNHAKRQGYRFDHNYKQMPYNESFTPDPTHPTVNLSQRSPATVVGHELGHMKNYRDMQRWGLLSPYRKVENASRRWIDAAPYHGLSRFGRSAALSAGTYAATGNEYLAAAAPIVPALPVLAEEAVASARGLNLMRQVRPEYRKTIAGLMKLLCRGRSSLSAFGTYAANGLAIGTGMLGATATKNLLFGKKYEEQ